MRVEDSIKKLKRVSLSFVMLLAIPACILFWYSVEQLQNEAESDYTNLAKALSDRIDSSIETIINKEEKRSFAEYSFFSVSGEKVSAYAQQSPLARFPVNTDIPGLLGYFQIDPQQQFSSPILPGEKSGALDFAIPISELQQRQTLSGKLFDILSKNQLVAKIETKGEQIVALNTDADETAESSSNVFSSRPIPQLDSESPLASDSTYSFEALESAPASKFANKTYEKLNDSLFERQVELSRAPESKVQKSKKTQIPSASRKELNVAEDRNSDMSADMDMAEELDADSQIDMGAGKSISVSMFEGDIEPFKFSFLSSGHIILFRSVWYDGGKYIQGAIIDQDTFINALIIEPFKESSLAPINNLLLVYADQVFKALKVDKSREYSVSNQELRAEFSVKYSLSAPLDKFDLVFSAASLPLGPQANVIIITALAFLTILCGGSYFLYRVGLRQIEITNQQRNFVSSVSHELKTPLTSIRMYGEALSKGWANEQQKTEYYDYILTESERLSRLIHNILQLSQAERGEMTLNNQVVYVGELVELISQKIQGVCESKSFLLTMLFDEDVMDEQVCLDKDAFTQVVINLIDNAMKFSREAERKEIQIQFESNHAELSIGFRDFGPGIHKDHLNKVFDFFYRAENELTRSTKGTGIGLALVSYLVAGMKAKISIENKQPGVEFLLKFTILSGSNI